MGREVRKVPANWKHPTDHAGVYKPLYPGEWYTENANGFMKLANSEGLQRAIDHYGSAPDKNDYMPDWPESERTHFMMYEDTSEGTPISPAFETPEKLAHWLADTGASAFGDDTADYDSWLRVAKGGFAPTAIYTPENGLQSGVTAFGQNGAS